MLAPAKGCKYLLAPNHRKATKIFQNMEHPAYFLLKVNMARVCVH
jgi:hypothetical protein